MKNIITFFFLLLCLSAVAQSDVPTEDSKSYLLLDRNGRRYFFGATAPGLAISNGTTWSIGSTLSVGLVLAPGTTSLAPLRFQSGTSLASATAGVMEYDGTNFFATNSTATRFTLAKTLTATATLDFADTVTGATTDLTITVTGAADGDVVSIGVPNGSVSANSNYTAWVSATNTVTIRFTNFSGGNINPASGTFRATVVKY